MNTVYHGKWGVSTQKFISHGMQPGLWSKIFKRDAFHHMIVKRFIVEHNPEIIHITYFVSPWFKPFLILALFGLESKYFLYRLFFQQFQKMFAEFGNLRCDHCLTIRLELIVREIFLMIIFGDIELIERGHFRNDGTVPDPLGV